MTRPRTLVVLLVLGFAACGGETPSPRPAGPPLPRLWTLGSAAADLPGLKLEVVIPADGKPRLDGEALDPQTFRERLRAFADAGRDGSDRLLKSNGLLIVRAHRDLPWRTAQYVLATAAHPSVRIWRTVFVAVGADGGPEGTFAIVLPGGHHHGRPPDEDEIVHRLDLRTRTDQPARPLDLRPVLSDPGLGLDRAHLRYEPWSNVPLEYALQVADVLHRAGLRRLHLAAPPPSGRSGSWPAAAPVGRPVLPGLRLDDQDLPATGTGLEPDVVRVEGLAGYVESPGPLPVFFGRSNSRREEPRPDAEPWLEVLVHLQEEDGSWGGGDVRVTGLVVLAFLESGQSHKWGRFKRNVKSGLRVLKQKQRPDGSFDPDPRASALATVAMADAYFLTSSPLFKQSAQLAIDHLVTLDLPPFAAALAEWMRTALRSGSLRQPAESPAGWDLSPAGGARGRLAAAVAGEMEEGELRAWQEAVEVQPVEGRTAEDLALAALVLSAGEAR